eukprot:GHVU01172672.1.p1 GENE.GHVU01172672.1~~GHVU01172672.1.p1  ORF type:complete len:209 (-),score=30.51 GHVU01172672.1:310-936(-)
MKAFILLLALAGVARHASAAPFRCKAYLDDCIRASSPFDTHIADMNHKLYGLITAALGKKVPLLDKYSKVAFYHVLNQVVEGEITGTDVPTTAADFDAPQFSRCPGTPSAANRASCAKADRMTKAKRTAGTDCRADAANNRYCESSASVEVKECYASIDDDGFNDRMYGDGANGGAADWAKPHERVNNILNLEGASRLEEDNVKFMHM